MIYDICQIIFKNIISLLILNNKLYEIITIYLQFLAHAIHLHHMFESPMDWCIRKKLGLYFIK